MVKIDVEDGELQVLLGDLLERPSHALGIAHFDVQRLEDPGFQFDAPAQMLSPASPLPQPGERGEPR